MKDRIAFMKDLVLKTRKLKALKEERLSKERKEKLVEAQPKMPRYWVLGRVVYTTWIHLELKLTSPPPNIPQFWHLACCFFF